MWKEEKGIQQDIARCGEGNIGRDMMNNAEKFLVQCVATQESLGSGVTSFDVLRHFVFHNRKKNIDLDYLPCTSATVNFYIRRAFF